MAENIKESPDLTEDSKKHCENCPPLTHDDKAKYCFNCGRKLEAR